MVLPAIPDWTGAMRACVHALRPGGLFVFTVNHPCFEQLWATWRANGEYRTRRYLAEYEIPGPSGVDFHRTISTYLNQLVSLGCQVTELAEPGLDPRSPPTVPRASTPTSTCRTSSSSRRGGQPDGGPGHCLTVTPGWSTR